MQTLDCGCKVNCSQAAYFNPCPGLADCKFLEWCVEHPVCSSCGMCMECNVDCRKPIYVKEGHRNGIGY